MDIRPHIQEAIRRAGSEAKLGEATGYSQHAIWKAKKRGSVTPEMALKIEHAVGVSKEILRPDIFGAAA